MTGFLALEDGTVFRGESVGAEGFAFGEAVFTTAMTGYQEIVTDPSYAEQIVCFTAPMVGNYGVAPDRCESRRPHARAVVMREARGPAWTDWLHEHGIVALSGIDTRSLVLHLREAGAMRAIAVAGEASVDEAVAAVASSRRWPAARSSPASRRTSRTSTRDAGTARIAVVDYGCKRSILDRLAGAGAAVTVYPHDVDADELARYDGVLLSNGPGDPEPLADEVETVRELLGRVPVLGICLGHQLLALATGHETFKLPFGHRGANHPVLEKRTEPRARHEPEPRLRGRAARTRPRRRTSRSTTARSRASTSRSCARARCSSIPRRGPARTTRGRSSPRWVEGVALAEAA